MTRKKKAKMLKSSVSKKMIRWHLFSKSSVRMTGGWEVSTKRPTHFYCTNASWLSRRLWDRSVLGNSQSSRILWDIMPTDRFGIRCWMFSLQRKMKSSRYNSMISSSTWRFGMFTRVSLMVSKFLLEEHFGSSHTLTHLSKKHNLCSSQGAKIFKHYSIHWVSLTRSLSFWRNRRA